MVLVVMEKWLRLMKITKLEDFKNNRIKVFLNDEFAFVLYKRELKKLPLLSNEKIKLDEEISDESVKNILKEVILKRAKLRSMNILLKQDRTERQLRDKLKEGLYTSDIIDETISYLKGYHYIDDERYARSYAEYRLCTKGRKALENELLLKGISRDVVRDVLDELYSDSEVDEYSIIRELARKKLHLSMSDDLPSALPEKDRNKLYRYLLSKGFTFDKVNGALDITLSLL